MHERSALAIRKFVTPEFIFGAGARHLAGRYAKNFGAKKVLIVTDPGVIQAGWAGQVEQSLQKENLPYARYAGGTPNPKAQEVMDGARVYKTEACNLIIAVGGGSPMDLAKGIGIVISNKDHILAFEGVDQVPMPGPPLICIPTTAGTSADVSQFAIIGDVERQLKIAIVSKSVVPDVALIDPVTTTTMDRELTACTGLDALCHAVEAYVSNASSPITDLHALEAVRLVAENLLPVTKDLENIDLRGKMMLGSLYAGMAFSNASLGAVHAMAHSLGGLLDTPHGESNALLLDHVVAYNFQAAAGRYLRIGEAMGVRPLPGQEKEALLAEVVRLREAVGINRTLGQMGVKATDIPSLAQKAMKDACMVTNPRHPSVKDIEEIYEKTL